MERAVGRARRLRTQLPQGVVGGRIPPDGASPGAYWHAASAVWSTVPGVLGLRGGDSTTTWAGDRLLGWAANDSDGPDGVELVFEPIP